MFFRLVEVSKGQRSFSRKGGSNRGLVGKSTRGYRVVWRRKRGRFRRRILCVENGVKVADVLRRVGRKFRPRMEWKGSQTRWWGRYPRGTCLFFSSLYETLVVYTWEGKPLNNTLTVSSETLQCVTSLENLERPNTIDLYKLGSWHT